MSAKRQLDTEFIVLTFACVWFAVALVGTLLYLLYRGPATPPHWELRCARLHPLIGGTPNAVGFIPRCAQYDSVWVQ